MNLIIFLFFQYTYYNQRYRRYEAVSSSLFEGPAQYNYSTFSSFDPIEPVAQSKAYILPYGVNAIQVTTTEKGITSRDIISKKNNLKKKIFHKYFSGNTKWNAY
jgi:hypothetical protein